MVTRDMVQIWFTTRKTEVLYGQPVHTYENLRSIMANVQYMTNEELLRTYGNIDNTAIIIKIPTTLIKIEPKDFIYLEKPSENDKGYYPIGEFEVDSSKRARFSTVSILNPVIVTAKKVIE